MTIEWMKCNRVINFAFVFNPILSIYSDVCEMALHKFAIYAYIEICHFHVTACDWIGA